LRKGGARLQQLLLCNVIGLQPKRCMLPLLELPGCLLLLMLLLPPLMLLLLPLLLQLHVLTRLTEALVWCGPCLG